MSVCLFVSYTRLLGLIRDGEVSQSELENGLFYFGCTEKNVQNPGAGAQDDRRLSDVDAVFHQDKRAGQRAMRRIRHAVHVAKKQGRAEFRVRGQHNNYDQLNTLLVRNGLPALDTNNHGTRYETIDFTHYAYPCVKMLVAAQNVPVRVMW